MSCRIKLLITLHCLQEHLKENGSRIITCTVRYEAHDKKQVDNGPLGSYCEQKVLTERQNASSTRASSNMKPWKAGEDS